MERRFEIEMTVRTYEQDSLRHTNNAVYLNWMEQARLAMFDELGFGPQALYRDEVLYNIVRAEIDFRAPTFYGDAVVIRTFVEKIGNSSVTIRSLMRRGDDGSAVCEGRSVIVWLGDDGRPTPIPDAARAALETAVGTEPVEGANA